MRSTNGPRETSPAAKGCAAWFRQLARALRTSRLYRGDNPLVQQVRGQIVEALRTQLQSHGAWTLTFTPSEICLGDELVVGPQRPAAGDTFSAAEERLPFLFYRDGVRRIHIQPILPLEEAERFFDALAAGCTENPTYEDLVTLLWEANLTYVRVDSIPLEQAFYLSGPLGARAGSGGAQPRRAGAASPAGGEPPRRARGLAVDSFDDWGVPDGGADVATANAELEKELEESRRRTLAIWREEQYADWDLAVSELFRRILLVDASEEMRAALAHAAATWLAHMIDRHEMVRAVNALELLHEVDPSNVRAARVLAAGLATVNAVELAEYLDEAEPAEQGRFAGLMVRIDRVATALTFQVMGHATRSRTRAAAATALCYQCADHPERLEPFMDDPRLDAMLNLVFVLGQIGGSGVADMLRAAAQHPDPRVRRQAVLSLGGVPEEERVPILLDELARLDPHILGTTLSLLARRRNERVSRFILGLIHDPGFETRSEDVQRALFNALADVAEDSAVPELEKLLNHSPGWLARRSFTQYAAALTLLRLGTPKARAAIQAGLASKQSTVRDACADAVKRKEAA